MSKHTDILRFRGELPERFAGAMLELGPLLGFAAGEGGTAVEVFRAAGPVVEKGPEGIRLGWEKPIHLYRALSLLRENWEKDTYQVSERPCFETGVMFDVSRNAVLRVGTIQRLLRSMALMGMDVGMMYTEDTYEVPEEPYFGYQRGKYSMEELRRLEDRALPEDTDYLSITGLRLEARQKLDKIRPLNLGQASRVSGVSPADVAVLMVYLKQREIN